MQLIDTTTDSDVARGSNTQVRMSTEQVTKMELLVCGFIHDIHKKHKSLNVPLDINNIIYLYVKFCDEWSREYTNNDINIDAITNEIKSNSKGMMTAFGSQTVQNGVYKWQIKLLSLTSKKHYYPYVGIIKSDEEHLRKYVDNGLWEPVGYQFCGANGARFAANITNYSCMCLWRKPNDVLEIMLDLDAGTMRLMVNGNDYGIAFENIEPGRYRLALSFDPGSYEAAFALL